MEKSSCWLLFLWNQLAAAAGAKHSLPIMPPASASNGGKNERKTTKRCRMIYIYMIDALCVSVTLTV